MRSTPSARSDGRGRFPGGLPRYYFAFAHLALAAAAGLLAVTPQTYVGFFYHPRMMAAVHLVTLGWLSSSILGGLYLALPLALRTRLSVGRLDHVAFWIYVIGVSGMVSHFWLDSYGGMVWSALLVTAGMAIVAGRAVWSVSGARIQLGVRLHLLFAAVNIILAASLGMLVGQARSHPLLPASTLDNVFAHLHLGAVGWVTMMALGIGYRLLPMMLPSKIPSGRGPILSAVLLEAGVLGLAAHFFLGLPAWTLGASAGAGVAGIVVFLTQIRWMLRHRAPRARHRPRRDLGRWHLGQALGFLVVAAGLGLLLASGWLEPEVALRLAPVYGVCGLLGFLGRMVAGVGTYLLPVASWVRATRELGASSARPAPDSLGSRRLQVIGFAAWTAAVPLLAIGQYLESAATVQAGGVALLIAAAAGGFDHRLAANKARLSA